MRVTRHTPADSVAAAAIECRRRASRMPPPATPFSASQPTPRHAQYALTRGTESPHTSDEITRATPLNDAVRTGHAYVTPPNE